MPVTILLAAENYCFGCGLTVTIRVFYLLVVTKHTNYQVFYR